MRLLGVPWIFAQYSRFIIDKLQIQRIEARDLR